MKKAAEVLVVGAGPGGSTVATFLARRGVEVLMLDRARFPRDKPCGEYISPGAAPILDALGVSERIEAEKPRHLRGMIISSPDGTRFVGEFPCEGDLARCRDRGFGMLRLKLDELLVRNAVSAGARLREGFVVTDLLLDAGRVVGVRGGEKELAADLVIGADGINSVVGRKLDLIRPIRSFARIGLVTHYEGMSGLTDFGEMHALPDCYCGVAPLGEGFANVSIGVVQRIYRDRSGSPEDLYDQLMERFPMVKDRIKGAKRVGRVRPMGPLAYWSRRATWNGAMLVGDASGFIDPYTGEGMYLAMRSGQLAAQVAAEALNDRNLSKERLVAYDALRRQELNPKYLLSALIQLILRRPWLMNFMVRRLARDRTVRDLLIGSTGDYISPRQILSLRYAARLLF